MAGRAASEPLRVHKMLGNASQRMFAFMLCIGALARWTEAPSNQSSTSQQSQQCDCSHSELMPGQPGQLMEVGLMPLHTRGAVSSAACLAKDRLADDQGASSWLSHSSSCTRQSMCSSAVYLLCGHQGTWLHPKLAGVCCQAPALVMIHCLH